MVDQFFFRCRLSFMERNDRLHRLPPLLMRNPDHGYILHGGMGTDDILHLGWEDILTAGDDHVGFSIHQDIITVLVLKGHISSRKPLTLKSRLRPLWVLPIFLKNVGC